MKIKVDTEKYNENLLELATTFKSGNEFLDQFIQSKESLNDGLGKTFVWIDEKRESIIGYYNIGVGYIDMLDGDDKYKIGGSIHLNFFALDEKYRGIVIDEKKDCIFHLKMMKKDANQCTLHWIQNNIVLTHV